ncbi:MAG: protein kinase [Kofleriaceae bacterium]
MMTPTLDPGDIVGPYRIVGPLGGGGMGMVYRAVHALLERPAAIKILRPELGASPMAMDRFLTEARATTAIRHPGIVEVFDYGHTLGGHAFIAMELLEGSSLGVRLAERGALPIAEAMMIARRIAAPLAAAHDRGIVHRDLKPDNVFLVRDHEGGTVDLVKLLDFGIAKLESTATSHRTTIGLILGTPAYMAPEQCLGTSDCDHRVDLYELGCILFEMLSGRPPYCAVPTTDLLAAHIRHPVPDLGRLVTIPSAVLGLVTRLLAKSPADRPRSALDVVAEIDRWFASRGPATPRRRSLRTAIVAASGIAISLAAVGIWYRASRDAPAIERPVAHGTEPAQPPPRHTLPVVTPLAEPTLAAPIDPPISPPRAAEAAVKAAPRRRPKPSGKPVEVTPELGRAANGGVDTTVMDVGE